MSTLAVTNTFVSGSTIQSSQVNQNFTDVATFLNTTGVNVYQAGSIVAAALAAKAVTPPALGIPALAAVQTNSANASATNVALSGTGLSVIASTNGTYLSTTLASSRITALVAGWILLFGQLNTAAGTTAVNTVGGFFKNGTLNGPDELPQAYTPASTNTGVTVVHVVSAAANDFFQLGGSTSVTTGTPTQVGWFCALYLGANS